MTSGEVGSKRLINLKTGSCEGWTLESSGFDSVDGGAGGTSSIDGGVTLSLVFVANLELGVGSNVASGSCEAASSRWSKFLLAKLELMLGFALALLRNLRPVPVDQEVGGL